jgi:hypothetical protein
LVDNVSIAPIQNPVNRLMITSAYVKFCNNTLTGILKRLDLFYGEPVFILRQNINKKIPLSGERIVIIIIESLKFHFFRKEKDVCLVEIT